VVLDLHRKQRTRARHAATHRKLQGQGFEVALTNYDNVQYQLRLQVGTPCVGQVTQWFTVVPDTGSSGLWIPAVNCTSCSYSQTPNASAYNASMSCSHKELGARVDFKYGDGTAATGVAVLDTVHLGELTVEDQYLIQVDALEQIARMQSDGILGLAHRYQDNGGTSKNGTFMETLFRQHPDLPPQFSLSLATSEEGTSKLVVGEPDLELHAKEEAFHYGKSWYMDETELWLTSVWSLGWSGTGVERDFAESGSAGVAALVDSGSSLIVLVPDVFDFMMGHLRQYLNNCDMDYDQNVLNCDCPSDREMERIPSLVVNIITEKDEQYPLCLAPAEFILRSLDDFAGPSGCVPAIQRGDLKQPVPIIVGMTFMRAFYTNFHLEANAIGFARSKHSPVESDAVCKIHEEVTTRRIIWVLSLASAALSVFLMLTVCFFSPKARSNARAFPEAGGNSTYHVPLNGQH